MAVGLQNSIARTIGATNVTIYIIYSITHLDKM